VIGDEGLVAAAPTTSRKNIQFTGTGRPRRCL